MIVYSADSTKKMILPLTRGVFVLVSEFCVRILVVSVKSVGQEPVAQEIYSWHWTARRTTLKAGNIVHFYDRDTNDFR